MLARLLPHRIGDAEIFQCIRIMFTLRNITTFIGWKNVRIIFFFGHDIFLILHDSTV